MSLIFLSKSFGIARYKTATTSNELAIFEPTIFPIPKSKSPFNAAPVLANNSGADVPNPINVAPIIELGILNFRAIWMAESTISSAPFTKKINPTTNPNMRINISMSCCLFF